MAAGDLQERAQAVVDELVSSGAETGLQVAVVRNGQLVADAVGGTADPGTGRPVAPDTLFFATSTAKGVASTVAHVLAECGVLDYDLRLAEVWPEFAGHGKGRVTLRHVLCHTAGVPGLPLDTTAADLCDWDRMCTLLAEARPWWEPRHPLPSADYANRNDVLTADIPSEGTMTARGAARMYSALLGHIDGVKLVSPQRLASMAAVTYRGLDEVVGVETQRAFGYSLYWPGGTSVEGSTFGMAGANGSAAYADIGTGVAVAVMRNRFTNGDFTAAARIGQLVS